MSAKKNDKDKAKKDKEMKKEAELAEQQRLADEEQRLAESRRRDKEDRERKEREAAEAVFNKEGSRLAEEMAEIEALTASRTAEVLSVSENRRKDAEWVHLVKCTKIPDCDKENEVNTYINILAETSFPSDDPSLDTLVPIINQADECCEELEATMNSRLGQIQKERERLLEQLILLRKTIYLQFESASARILQYMDQMVEDTSENFTCSKSFQEFKHCLWANLTKNPRHKTIDFVEQGIHISLPKALVLAGVGMRLLYETGSTAACRFKDTVRTHLTVIGGVLHMDLVELPEWPTKSERWTLRKILTPQNKYLRRVSYPFTVDPAETVPEGEDSDVDVTVTLKLSPTIASLQNATIMNWNSETNAWTSDGIRDVLFEPELEQVTFKTCYLRPTAIIQTTPPEYPLTSWSIKPTDTGVLVEVVGRQHTLLLEITERDCSILKPETHVSSSQTTPSLRLRRLAHSGLNFIGPREVNGLELDGVVLKNPAAEDSCISGIPFWAAGMQFRSSPSNKKIGSSKVTFQVRQADATADEEAGWTHVFFDAQVQVGEIYKKVGFVTNEVTEETKVTIDDSNGPQIHATVFHALKSIQKTSDARTEPSAIVSENLEQVMSMVRSFSVIASEAQASTASAQYNIIDSLDSTRKDWLRDQSAYTELARLQLAHPASTPPPPSQINNTLPTSPTSNTANIGPALALATAEQSAATIDKPIGAIELEEDRPESIKTFDINHEKVNVENPVSVSQQHQGSSTTRATNINSLAVTLPPLSPINYTKSSPTSPSKRVQRFFSVSQLAALREITSTRSYPSLDSPIWEALFQDKFDAIFSRQEQAIELEMATIPLGQALIRNNSSTKNFNTLLLYLLSQLRFMRNVAYDSEWPVECQNAMFLCRIFIKTFVDNLSYPQIHDMFENDRLPPDSDASSQTRSSPSSLHEAVEGLGASKMDVDPDVVIDPNPRAELLLEEVLNVIIYAGYSPLSSYEIYLESLNLLIVMCASQLQHPSDQTVADNYFLDVLFERFGYLANDLIAALLLNFVKQPQRPSLLGGVLYSAYSYLFNNDKQNPTAASPIAEKSVLVFLILANQYPKHYGNAFRRAIGEFEDLEAKPSKDIEAPSSPAKDMAAKVSFRVVYDQICSTIPSEETSLLLYLLMLKNDAFRVYILCRTDVDGLVLPILKHIHDTLEVKTRYSQLYVLLIVILLLTQDDTYNENLQRIMITPPPWYADRIIKSISLAGFTTLILVKTIQDHYFHTNCLAALANMSSKTAGMHSVVASRLINLLDLVTRRYGKLMGGLPPVYGAQTPTTPMSIMTPILGPAPNSVDCKVYSDVIALILEIINSVMTHTLQHNPQLVYALLHRRDMFARIETEPRFAELVENINTVVSHFQAKLSEAGLRSPTSDEVLQVIERAAKTWQGTKLRAFEELKFQYEEEQEFSLFFLPYVWSLIYRSSLIHWDESNTHVLLSSVVAPLDQIDLSVPL
ncbi:hypothetical protein SmJEL517_g06103 [Synchytrium microbalum]|uniref:Dymeclin n=1 Tax=Synchytrium microbalum TaxID=1806994 RepID=A0A507BRD2_9FUNG|nr:uncharacterized protein SmJEL517_g06103 [Synchytrium microbalum]TPX30312.1 hypothetical protein SmJEL517_g06103 [Synchytrium microbalum]